jgi:fructokinase
MFPERKPRVLCFGEVLWDCLPQGRLPGGAPLNVAYHLAKLGVDARMISAVGADAPGDEMLALCRARGLSTEFIARDSARPTGTVTVALDAAGQPAYTIHEEVAWDAIPVDAGVRAARSDALVFGSLAARSAANRAALDELLAMPGTLRIMDVNLRPPFADRGRVLALCARADWVKLNDHELAMLSRKEIRDEAADAEALGAAIEALRRLTGNARICVTRGARGAALCEGGEMLFAAAPAVKVRDTIGAGDAFTAALVHGILVEKPRIEALRFACALGALVASLPGGQPDYDPEMARTDRCNSGAGC